MIPYTITRRFYVWIREAGTWSIPFRFTDLRSAIKFVDIYSDIVAVESHHIVEVVE